MFPMPFLGSQLAPSRAGQTVEPGLPVVIGSTPLALYPTPFLDSIERRIQCAFFNLEHIFGQLLDALPYAVAMHRPERQRLQDQHIECPLRQLRLLLWHSSLVLIEPILPDGSLEVKRVGRNALYEVVPVRLDANGNHLVCRMWIRTYSNLDTLGGRR